MGFGGRGRQAGGQPGPSVQCGGAGALIHRNYLALALARQPLGTLSPACAWLWKGPGSARVSERHLSLRAVLCAASPCEFRV